MQADDFEYIDEEVLGNSEEISLWLGLVSRIEKDIDWHEKDRFGASPWQLGLAVAAVSIPFLDALSKDKQTFSNISFLAFVVAYHLIQCFFYLVTISNWKSHEVAKPGRVYSFREKFQSASLFFVLQFAVSIGSVIAAASSSLEDPLKTSLVILLSACTFLPLLWLISYIRNLMIGASPLVAGWLKVLLPVVLTLLSGSLVAICIRALYLPWKKEFADEFKFGLLLGVLIYLISLLVASLITPTQIDELNDIRDNVLFRRYASLNAAILAYRQVKEGRMLNEEVAKELEVFDLLISGIHGEITRNSARLEKLLAEKNDDGELKDLKIGVENIGHRIIGLDEKAGSLIKRISRFESTTDNGFHTDLLKEEVVRRWEYLRNRYQRLYSCFDTLPEQE